MVPAATHRGTVVVVNADVLTQQLPSLQALPAQHGVVAVPQRWQRFSAAVVL
jgi:hypothetical protein